MTFLARILDDTRAHVERQKCLMPLRALEERPSFSAPTLPFGDVLRRRAQQGGPAIIAEMKKASPSAGPLRTDFRPADLAAQYRASGAAAISILTEPVHFQGSLEHLAAARFATDLPLLRKDFVIDEYQLVEARAYGADAVLLIAAALEPGQLRYLHRAALDLGLTPLVEIHHEHELERVDLDHVQVLGVNNRDLTTFEMDTGRAERVLRHIPERIVRIAESGLRSADDLVRAIRVGVDAFLIGEAFMRSAHPGRALQRLRTETAEQLRRPLRLAV